GRYLLRWLRCLNRANKKEEKEDADHELKREIRSRARGDVRRRTPVSPGANRSEAGQGGCLMLEVVITAGGAFAGAHGADSSGGVQIELGQVINQIGASRMPKSRARFSMFSASMSVTSRLERSSRQVPSRLALRSPARPTPATASIDGTACTSAPASSAMWMCSTVPVSFIVLNC